jgi:hypothetical protein
MLFVAYVAAEKRTTTQLAAPPPWLKATAASGMFTKAEDEVELSASDEAMYLSFVGLQIPVAAAAAADAKVVVNKAAPQAASNAVIRLSKEIIGVAPCLI